MKDSQKIETAMKIEMLERESARLDLLIKLMIAGKNDGKTSQRILEETKELLITWILNNEERIKINKQLLEL